YSTRTVHALIAPNLCHPIILGLPFLSHNNIVVDAHNNTAIDYGCNFDLLHPMPHVLPKVKVKLCNVLASVRTNRKLLIEELKTICKTHWPWVDAQCEKVVGIDIIAAIQVCIEQLAANDQLEKLGAKIKDNYADVFKPIPHVDEMLSTVLCKISLKDTGKTITTRSYSCPGKFCNAWSILIPRKMIWVLCK
ncbi:hypothetical protein L208DRAFT_1260953, partial [Tricholoma matsutake]